MAQPLDVLFINPGDRKQLYQNLGDGMSAIEPPIYSAMFADYMRRKGYSVAIYDTPAMSGPAEHAARAAVEDYKARLIVIPVYGFQPSASTQNMSSAGKIAKLIKEASPAQKILITGTHPAALPKRTLMEEAVDYVCDGEGPITIEAVVEALKGSGDVSRAPALWRIEDGEVIPPQAAAPLITDLDGTMPLPAWDLLPMDRYRAHNWHCFDHIDQRQPYASLYTTLGCPFKCNFCCINAPFGKPSYRMWSPETVVAMIGNLVKNYGVKNIKFVDEMFVLNKRHVEAICDGIIANGYDVNIWAYARVDTAYPELLDKMRAAGINWLALGIESASDFVRDGAEKSLNDSEIVQAVRRVEDAGIHVLGNYIFGLPDDTLESMQRTLDMALELKSAFINFYSAMAYPGSQLYTEAVSKGAKLPEQWHHFSQHAYDTLPLANDQLSAGEILAFRDYAFDRYFHDQGYLSMVEKRFGTNVLDHIKEMRAMTLPRKLLDEDPSLMANLRARDNA
ncbi:B12-binding domain-containing radical SAM protein [Magnetofaba australis]|uniref:Putative radical SAM domain-containing protein n=1 Tax=Magnetofaba australis IT-1 TaxID=1434232 RepID=A0A1Y2K944_9PROT|nr:radical SAM protein [Magnetofaba australis]OSM05206.1 putative radical SAM domain-containing protein [Magnetofaba australis IT-1]